LLANGGDYDKMVDMRTVRIAPGIAVAFTDKLSFGATANIDIQALRANLAHSITPVGLTLFDQTAGEGDWDFSVGAGFTVGLLYEMSDMLNLGASYESHGWQGHHYKYKDCLPYIDEPPIINLGLSFKPIKDLEITYDTRYINWTDVKIARNAPASGGFGWNDQWAFAVGSEYTTYKDRLKLRLGYMYGKSPIQPNVVFGNSLLPLIVEHHLTGGFSFFLTKNLSLDLAWEHHFKNSMTDEGGDSADLIGTGTKITAAVDVISVGLGYKF
jgi:long-chain fatty acid transport protein